MVVYTLDGRQKKALHAALLAAFPRQASLERLVEFHLDAHLAVVAGEGPLADVAFRLMEWAEAQGRLDALVNGARGENPDNPQLIAFERMVLEARDARPRDPALRQFAERVRLAPVVPADPDLEKRVFRAGFSDIAQWRARLGQAEVAVCRIEAPAWRALGTGFLVGPDLVMTNRHVIEALLAQAVPPIVVRFDFKVSADGTQLREGRTFGLADAWLVASSPVGDLDFAILRLAEPAGRLPNGGTPGAPPRGWLTPAWREPEPDETLFVIQHPQGDALKLAAGRFASRDATRLRYRVDTEPGSSGSPCFTAQLELVALHRGAADGDANEGVPFDAIVAALPTAARDALTMVAPDSPAAGGPVTEAMTGGGVGMAALQAGGAPVRSRAVVMAAALLVLVLACVVAWWRPWRPVAASTSRSRVVASPGAAGLDVHEAVVPFTWERLERTQGGCESEGGVIRALYRGRSRGPWPAPGRRGRELQLVAYRGVRIEKVDAATDDEEALAVAGSPGDRTIHRKLQFQSDVTVPVTVVACVRSDGPPPEPPPFRVTTWKEASR